MTLSLCDIFRYSTMLAENLVDNYKPLQQNPNQEQLSIKHKEEDGDDATEPSELNVGKWKVVVSSLYSINLEEGRTEEGFSPCQ